MYLYSIDNCGYGFNGHYKDNEISGENNHISFNDYGYNPRIGRRWQIDPIDQIGISPYAAFNNNPNIYLDPTGQSPISIFVKAVAKAGLKRAAKAYVKKQIRKRLKAYLGKNAKAWAKQLANDALTFVDHATKTYWWEWAIEIIPVAGDAYGASKLGKQGYTLWKGLERFDKVGELAGLASSKAYVSLKRIGINDGFVGKGANFLKERFTKFEKQGEHLNPDDLGGAVKEIFGLSSNGQHLKEATEALQGMKKNIGLLENDLAKFANIGAENRDVAFKILNHMKKQYQEKKAILDKAYEAVKTHGKFTEKAKQAMSTGG